MIGAVQLSSPILATSLLRGELFEPAARHDQANWDWAMTSPLSAADDPPSFMIPGWSIAMSILVVTHDAPINQSPPYEMIASRLKAPQEDHSNT
jgi:hypothetical protein